MAHGRQIAVCVLIPLPGKYVVLIVTLAFGIHFSVRRMSGKSRRKTKRLLLVPFIDEGMQYASSVRDMKIAFPMFGMNKVGGNKVIVRLADVLCNRGHEVSIVIPRKRASSVLRTLAEIVEVEPFPLLKYSLPTIMPAASFPLAKKLRGFDAIIANYAPTCLPTKLADGEEVKQYYLVQHDETKFFSRFSLEYWVTRLSYRAFESGRILVVSKWLQDLIRKRSGIEATLVPPGIDHDVFYPRKRSAHSGSQILVLARDEKWRGMSVFIEAMEIVTRKVPDVMILAAGQSSKRYKTGCLIEYVQPSDAQLAELYSSCDVFVLPSFVEGLPVPPLEAMSCGDAVVVTDCLGTRDYAVDGHNCLVVPPRNPSSLSDAILRILGENGLAERLRRNGPSSAASWTYERMGRLFVEKLESD